MEIVAATSSSLRRRRSVRKRLEQVEADLQKLETQVEQLFRRYWELETVRLVDELVDVKRDKPDTPA